MQNAAQKVLVFGVILVQIFPAFPRIRTDVSVFSPNLPVVSPNAEKCKKLRTRITPNTDTFYEVKIYTSLKNAICKFAK